MRKSNTTPEEYLDSLPEDVRQPMLLLDGLISTSLAGRARDVWEGVFWGGTEQRIIGYGDIVQPRPKGESVEWFAVGLARQQARYSIYVNAVESGRYLLEKYEGRLGKAKLGSASVSFKDVADLDRDALAELLDRANLLTLPDR
jgi:hypothetical protein